MTLRDELTKCTPRRTRTEQRKSNIRMWGYLPAASLHRASLLNPTCVPPSSSLEGWRSVCSGGCGVGLAISESGKIYTWGSINDLGQCEMRRRMQELPEPYLLPVDANMIEAAGGWAHFVSVTDTGVVYTWGWSKCVPSLALEQGAAALAARSCSQGNNDGATMCLSFINEHKCLGSTSSLEALKSWAIILGNYGTTQFEKSQIETRSSCTKFQSTLLANEDGDSKSLFRVDKVDDNRKGRRIRNSDATSNDMSAMDENIIAPPSIVMLSPGVFIISVAAGGRHTLALSDGGKVWGWGYGGDGQLGLGSRLHMISTPQLIPDLKVSHWTNTGSGNPSISGVAELLNLPQVSGSHMARIACGGRHSVVLTNAGEVLTFGWGLYGQCAQGSTEDELSPVYVSSLGGIKVTGLAAGLWHTVFVTDTGDVYASGGNQFGQLGTGGDQAETLPTLIDSPVLENEEAKHISCGARHTAVLTEKGKIFCWGWNKYGQLGLGDTVDRDTPVEIPLKTELVRRIACGWWHTLALVEEIDTPLQH